MKDPITDDETEVEIDLDEIDWSAPPGADELSSVYDADELSTVERAPEAPAAEDPFVRAAEDPFALIERDPRASAAPPRQATAASSATAGAEALEEAERPKQQPKSRQLRTEQQRQPKAERPQPKAERPQQRTEQQQQAEPQSQQHSFHAAFAEIVRGVEPAPLRAVVGSTFARLLRVLDTLAVMEKALSRPQAVKVGSLFDEVRVQTASLLTHVNFVLSGGDGLEPRVREALDGVRFVIGHETAKVFRQEFPGINTDRHEYTRADLTRAWGLLQNCLQQTAIALAQTFAPGVTGEQLFEDYRRKVEDSLTLYGELTGLLHRVRAAEGSSGILLKHTLVRHLEHFRDETMRFLMYKDWAEFGRYVEKVGRAFEEMEEFDAVLHEFAQYLGTLIHHVGMREVLRAAAPPRPGAAGAAGFDPFAQNAG
ncbi:MAG TPA: hypothetical protein VNZ44_16780 [Pyrinomonadaceae bacterium]|nr:hypothetical protein [Pyrinomonadaceae bacterium]